jgi:hypothetical protein
MATLPDIGLNGLVNSVRKIGGYIANPGYRDVDPATSFVAGMAATLTTDSDGKVVLTAADNTTSTGKIIGLFYCHKTTSFYRAVKDELQVVGTSPNTASLVYLAHANLKAGSIRVVQRDLDETVYAEDTNYTCNDTNGVVTVSTGIGATEALLISYLYLDPNLIGIDQTLGSGKAATLEDNGEIGTMIYDTSKAYTLNASLYVNSAGYLTTTAGAAVVGMVTKPPTSEDPELHFKMKLA